MDADQHVKRIDKQEKRLVLLAGVVAVIMFVALSRYIF